MWSFHIHMALIPQGSLVYRKHCLLPVPAPAHLQVPVQFRKYEYKPIIPRDPPQLQRNANIEHSSTRLRVATEVENLMTSVQRVIAYTRINSGLGYCT